MQSPDHKQESKLYQYFPEIVGRINLLCTSVWRTRRELEVNFLFVYLGTNLWPKNSLQNCHNSLLPSIYKKR